MEAIFIILLMNISSVLQVIKAEKEKEVLKFSYFCLGFNFALLLASIMMYIIQNKN